MTGFFGKIKRKFEGSPEQRAAAIAQATKRGETTEQIKRKIKRSR